MPEERRWEINRDGLTSVLTCRGTGRGRRWTVTGDPAVPDGSRLASVSAILGLLAKPALISWAKNFALDHALGAFLAEPFETGLWTLYVIDMIERSRKAPDAYREESAAFGQRVHELITEIIRTGSAEVEAEYKPYIEGFLGWSQYSKLRLEVVEHPVYHSAGWVGELDAIGRGQGKKIVMLDFKTGGAIYDETALQLSAYAAAYGHVTGKYVTDARAVRLDPVLPSGWEEKSVAKLDSGLSTFYRLNDLYWLLKEKAWA